MEVFRSEIKGRESEEGRAKQPECELVFERAQAQKLHKKMSMMEKALLRHYGEAERALEIAQATQGRDQEVNI